MKAYFASKLRSIATGKNQIRIMVDSTRKNFKNDVLEPGLTHTDGGLHGEDLPQGFVLAKTVWNFLFQQPTRAGEARQTLNLVWNWEMRPSDPNVAPKAYFFLAEELDETVIAALTALFEELGWTEHIETQTKVDKISYPEHNFATSCGLYYWIAAAFSQKSGPYGTVYSNPAAIL